MYEKKYKFLIIGGLHGNEPLGIELVKKIQALNLPNIQAVYGNPQAIKQNVRFVEADLNRVFPGKIDGNLEEKRAFELMQICANYDFVLDFHNTHCSNNDCSFVGGGFKTDLIELTKFFGLTRIIDATYDCLNKYAQNCLSIEISLDSPLNDPIFWLRKVQKLSDSNFNFKNQKAELKKFRFFGRKNKTEFEKLKSYNLKAFKALKLTEKEVLGLPKEKEIYPIFIADIYTSDNYELTLVERVES